MTTLTPQERDLLQTFLAHAKPDKDLAKVLGRFNPKARGHILKACYKIKIADYVLPKPPQLLIKRWLKNPFRPWEDQ